jgi:hypothetical protein
MWNRKYNPVLTAIEPSSLVINFLQLCNDYVWHGLLYNTPFRMYLDSDAKMVNNASILHHFGFEIKCFIWGDNPEYHLSFEAIFIHIYFTVYKLKHFMYLVPTFKEVISIWTNSLIEWAPKVLDQWHMLLLFWFCTPALWIWNETMTMMLKCRLSALIWGYFHQLLRNYRIFLHSPPPHFRGPKVLEQIHLK